MEELDLTNDELAIIYQAVMLPITNTLFIQDDTVITDQAAAPLISQIGQQIQVALGYEHTDEAA